MPNPIPLTQALQPAYLSPVTATISLPAIAHNLAEIRNLIAPSCDILPIIKADGYGHGAIAVANALTQLGIHQFGVSTVEEGCELRANNIQGDILVMGGMLPEHLSEMVHHQLTPVLSNLEIAQQLAHVRHGHPKPYPVHVKVDTGMRRLGIAAHQLVSFLDNPLCKGPLHIAGIMTHLADADNPEPSFTHAQLTQFRELLDLVQGTGRTIPMAHAANTAALISHPSAHLGMVRPGLMLYGYAPTIHLQHKVNLQPAIRLTTNVVHIRNVKAGEPLSYNGIYRTTQPSRIAILPVGYSHGVNRRLANQGEVLVKHGRAPIVGNICMDMMFIDVTACPMIKQGDEVVLLGKYGDHEISAHDVADWQGTIPYEVLCAIGPRMRRIYEPFS